MGKKRTWRQGDLSSKNAVGGSRYLHYWFHDSGLQIQDFEAAKKACLRRQLKHFKTVRMKQINVSGANMSEVYTLVNETTKQEIGDLLDEKIARVFSESAKPVTASASSGIGGESFATMGKKSRDSVLTQATVGDLTNALVASQKASQNALDGIVEVLRVRYGSIVDEAIKASTLNESVQNTEEIRNLIQTVIKSGSKILKLEEGTKEPELMQSIARLNMLVQLIPLISESSIVGLKATYSSGKPLEIETHSQLLAVMLGKIGGNLNSLGGLAEEIAVARGLELALKEGAGVCVQGIEYTGQNSKYANVTIDNELKHLANNPLKNFIQGKDDIRVVVSKNGVTIDYGLSVKKATKSQKNNSLNVKLQEDMSLNILLNRLSAQEGVSKKYIYNVAGGREKSGETGLQAAWKNIVDYAVITAFLDVLSGIGTTGNNSIALVVNRKIYPVEKILQAVENNPSAIKSSGGRQRSKFWQLNEWFGEEDDKESTKALFRSNAAWGKIQQAFQSTKLTISLNLATLKLT